MVELIAVSSFQSQEGDELSFGVGDIIKNSKCTKEDGWWEGELNGRRGRFPRIFLKEMPTQTNESGNRIQPRSMRRKPVVKKKKQRWCEVVISYSPVKAEELELNLGDVIEILDEIEDGWWIGRKNGQTGGFPSNFVIEMDNTDGKARGFATESDFGVLNESMPSSDIQVPMFGSLHPSASLGKPGSGRQQLEYYKAAFDYTTWAEDELNLRKGDVILVLEKETGEEGWWEGYMDGKQGLFPDNYVVPYVEEAEMSKDFPPGVKTDVDLCEKEEPKNERSGTVVKPGTLKKVPPPVKVKPVLSTLQNKVNGEQALAPQDQKKTARDRNSDSDSVTFDILAASTEKLTHPTTDRPKAKGRRPPSQFVTSPVDVKRSVQLSGAKVTALICQQTDLPPLKMHRGTAGKPPTDLTNSTSKPQREAESDDKAITLLALRAEVRSLQLSVDLLKNQHLSDITALKEEIAEERIKRNALQAEIENLRKFTTTLQKH
ncbi:SH3 domain-containing protein 21 isoform X2 [Hemiscyllium ocellatum]|uniref:SH3 domain-containing protein 21 isoform X2 n=1 Tax=Hemiscyllium ocellatum TaxID=170820 RepID=UPI00296611FF|nr:SH3 domain-containing protein 21 isoform X2 [Hemiscyllium ocellatum]